VEGYGDLSGPEAVQFSRSLWLVETSPAVLGSELDGLPLGPSVELGRGASPLPFTPSAILGEAPLRAVNVAIFIRAEAELAETSIAAVAPRLSVLSLSLSLATPSEFSNHWRKKKQKMNLREAFCLWFMKCRSAFGRARFERRWRETCPTLEILMKQASQNLSRRALCVKQGGSRSIRGACTLLPPPLPSDVGGGGENPRRRQVLEVHLNSSRSSWCNRVEAWPSLGREISMRQLSPLNPGWPEVVAERRL
jgi:hypothetical protein